MPRFGLPGMRQGHNVGQSEAVGNGVNQGKPAARRRGGLRRRVWREGSRLGAGHSESVTRSQVLLGRESKPRKAQVSGWRMKTGHSSGGGSLLGQTRRQERGGGSPHQAPVGHHQHDIHPGEPVTAGRHGLPTPRGTAPVYPAALPRQPGLRRGNGAWVLCSSPAISLRGKTKADPARKHGGWEGA